MTDTVLNEAVHLSNIHFLRAYDAVQLATALESNRKRLNKGLNPLIFVSADNELNDAAKAEGLNVENPNDYP